MRALAGLLLPPAAWLAGFQAVYSLTPLVCFHREWSFVLHLVPPLTLLGTGFGFWLALREWRTSGAGWPGESADPATRGRFLGALGMLFSGYLSLVVVAQWLPVFLLNPCQR